MIEPPRSPHWEARAAAHLLRQPACLCCGRTDVKRNVHHKYPFHFIIALGRPDLEEDERNLYTLCVEHDEEHHLLVGHLGSFESYNPRLEETLALCRGLLSTQIRSLPHWQKAMRQRPKPLGAMNVRERRALRRELDRVFPLER